MTRISAPLVAAAWRSGFRNRMAGAGRGAAWLRQRLSLVAPVFALAARLGSNALSRIVKGRWAPWTIGPAIGMSLGALGFEAHDIWRTSMNAPAMERLAAPPPAGEDETSNSEDGRVIDESPEENTRMSHWKRAVEEALKDAAATQPTPREGATGSALTGSAESRPQHSKPRENEAAAKAQDPKAQVSQKQKADTRNEINPFANSPLIDGRQSAENGRPEDEAAAKARDPKAQDLQKEADAGQEEDAGKEVNPFVASPLIDPQQLDRNAGPIGVIPFVRREGPPFWQMRAQVRGRRHWKGRHFGWGIFRFHFIGR